MNSQRIVHLAMTHHNWGSRWRVNSLFTQISFQINLHWTQLRGIENPKKPLRPEDNDHRNRAAGCHAESLPDVVHDFQIRCNFQNRVFWSWVYSVWENFMGPRGLKVPPLLLKYPLGSSGFVFFSMVWGRVGCLLSSLHLSFFPPKSGHYVLLW